MRLIDANALKEHKFVSINCYLKSNDDNGYSRYKQGWNDAIDAIIYNAPTVLADNYSMGYQDGVKKVLSERPQGEWIPVSERLPNTKINPLTKDFEYVSCTTVWGDVRPYRFGKPIHMKEAHFWDGCMSMDKFVVAWQPLPKPFKEAENE